MQHIGKQRGAVAQIAISWGKIIETEIDCTRPFSKRLVKKYVCLTGELDGTLSYRRFLEADGVSMYIINELSELQRALEYGKRKRAQQSVFRVVIICEQNRDGR
jgi:hypothetical protein